MNRYRSWCSLLFGYDWVGIPLVYTQVSNTVHMTFISACSLGHWLWATSAVLSLGFLSIPGCHSGCLHLLFCVPDWTPVFGSHRRLRWAWLRSLHSNLYSPTILLLRRMAQGSQRSQSRETHSVISAMCQTACWSFPEPSQSFLRESKIDVTFNGSEMLFLFIQGLKCQGCGEYLWQQLKQLIYAKRLQEDSFMAIDFLSLCVLPLGLQ